MALKSHGNGKFKVSDFSKMGKNVVIEDGVLVFHPENIEIGDNVYIGHNTILKGYYKNKLVIENDVWIGQNCFFHSAAGIVIRSKAGIGPGVTILGSTHDLTRDNLGPIIDLPLSFKPVEIKSGTDIGCNAIILPGVIIGEGTQVGAGAVVTKSTKENSIVAGVPAKLIRMRSQNTSKKSITKLIKNNLVGIIKYFFDAIFLILFPLLIIYSWLRFAHLKITHKKPRVIFSPLGVPMSYFTAKALRSVGYSADVYAAYCPDYFKPISYGLNLTERFYLRILNYLTDHTLLFAWSLVKYDLFENNFAGGFLYQSHLRKLEYVLMKLCAKKIVVHGYGSDCKFISEVKKLGKYNNAMDRTEKTENTPEQIIRENVYRAQKYADVLIAGGDITHLGKKAIMLPLAVDLSYWQGVPHKKKSKVVFLHSTNHRDHKGSRFIIEIFEKLKKKNKSIELLLVERKNLKECQEIYKQADVFITDVVTGWHGLTACEGMHMSRPVISHIKKDIHKAHNYYASRIPLIDATPDNLEKVVLSLAKDANLQKKIGQAGYEYVTKYHSLEVAGKFRSIIYERIWQNKPINQKVFEKELKHKGLI